MKIPFRKPKLPAPRQRLSRESAPIPSAYSYHSRRDEREASVARSPGEASETVKQRRTKRRALRRPAVVAFFAIGSMLGLYLIFLTSSPVITVEGTSLTSVDSARQAEYQQTATNRLQSSLLNHLKPFVHTRAVAESLQQQYPEIQAAKVVVPFFGHKPQVHVILANPALVLASSHGNYALNDNGKVIVANATSHFSVPSSTPVVTDKSNFEPQLNQYALSTKNVTFIKTVLAQLKAKKVAYGSLTLPESASELDVHIANQPYYVKFNLQSDTPREQIGTYLAAQQEMQHQHITPSKYIDVRVPGRAYYQ